MSNLNSAQFDEAFDIEAQQRRRFKRKHESGYVGNGYWYSNYPYMYGAMGTGGKDETAQHEKGETPEQEAAEQHGNLSENMGESASATDGSSFGGTAAGYVGGLGS